MSTARERTRRQIIRDIRAAYAERFGRRISDSDARAMMRGEADTESYRLAFRIMQEYGWE